MVKLKTKNIMLMCSKLHCKLGCLSLLLGFLVFFVSCTNNFNDINKPAGKLSIEELQRDNYAVGSFLIQMQGVAFPEQENAYQTMIDFVGNYLGRYTTYTKELSKNHTLFNASNNWCAWPASYAPKVVSAFNEIKRLSGDQSAAYALALILRSQSFLRFTDIYGPFPLGLDDNNPNVYTPQPDIYKMLIADLNRAIAIIKTDNMIGEEKKIFAPYDMVYRGDFDKWIMFANSLKLRMAIRISSVAPQLAQQLGEKAVRDGVIEDNIDNCTVNYLKSGLWVTAVSWGDSRICADLESYMTGYKDPRLASYFKPTALRGNRMYIGCRAGAPVSSNVLAKRLYSTANVTETTPGVWLTASEMAFCRAEGALRGWNMGGGTAKDFYEQGVRLSFEQWDVEGASEYLADSLSTEADYVDNLGGFGGDFGKMSEITIKWKESATMQEKLERIITQKWIALFPNGQEAWDDLRRTGYPHVFPIPQNTDDYNLLTPNRIPFDRNERINNRENYLKAIEYLGGGDNYGKPMWWQY